ncbi:MAG: cytochrome C [Pyrobaculum sp.]
MGKAIYLAVAIIAVIIGAAAFTYQPAVEVKTATKVTTVTEPAATVTEPPVTITAGAPGAPATPALQIKYNEELAKKGIQLFKDLACVACHTVKAVGIEVGGNLGPDLSKALLGSVGVEKGTAGGPMMMKYFEKHGLKDPAADPERAAQLIAKLLIEGDKELAPTMFAQTEAFKKRSGYATEEVPALVEMFKMAATKS